MTVRLRAGEEHYVLVSRGQAVACGSPPFGYVTRPGQRIVVKDDCSVNTAIHEFGHALGLNHEHQRGDRDQ